MSSLATVSPRAIAVSGDHAFLADAGWGIQVIDISTPSVPAVIDTCPLWSTRDVTAAGDLILVATRAPGLILLDVSIPSAPAR